MAPPGPVRRHSGGVGGGGAGPRSSARFSASPPPCTQLWGIKKARLGSFIPFLRETYGFSYDLSGVLLSCQSVGNLISVLIAGFLPLWLGRRRGGWKSWCWRSWSCRPGPPRS